MFGSSKQCVRTEGFLRVQVFSGRFSFSRCSSWGTAYMVAGISAVAQDVVGCVLSIPLSSVVLLFRRIRCIRDRDHCSAMSCFVRLVLPSICFVSFIQITCILDPCVLHARDVLQSHPRHSKQRKQRFPFCTVLFRLSCLLLVYL